MGLSIIAAQNFRLAPELQIVEEVEAFDPTTGEYPSDGRVIRYESSPEAELGREIPEGTVIRLIGPTIGTSVTYTYLYDMKEFMKKRGINLPLFDLGFDVHGQVSGQSLMHLAAEFRAVDKGRFGFDPNGYSQYFDKIKQLIDYAGSNGIIIYS